MTALGVSSTREVENLEDRVKEILAEEQESCLREIRRYMHRRKLRVENLIDPRRTQFEQVEAALRTSAEPMTVREIAELTGLDPAAVRMVVYSRQNAFSKSDSGGPRNTRWSIAPRLQTTGADSI